MVSSINSSKNLLSIQCSTGVMPAFFSVSCISLNPSIRYFFFLDLIVVASIGPASESSITIMYLFPRAEMCGYAPVWSLDNITFRSLNFTAVTCTMCLRFSIFLGGRYYSDGSSVISSVISSAVTFLLVEDSFLLCVDVPLVFGLISEDVFGFQLLLILERM